jgi:2-polyprenyl-3-methyl-5-hydroxy-6-metoxy-1,4-benzoquinol methylase
MTIYADDAAQHFVLREDDPKRHEAIKANIVTLWNDSHCQVIRCDLCGFGFSFPFVAGDATFYNLAYTSEGYPRDKWDFSRTLSALQTMDTKGKSALEVAAGNGFFLDKIVGALFERAKVVATEYNEGSIKNLKSKGYTAFRDDIRASAFDDKKAAFDFIFLFQVVEHMTDLAMLFNRLRMLIRTGGSVFITVPNQVRTIFQEASNSLLDMPPNHVGRWTPAAFRAITHRHGFKVVTHEVEPFNYSVFLKTDIFYSHRRRSQRAHSIANRVRGLPRGILRTSAEAATMAVFAPSRIPTWVAAFPKRSTLGASLWIQLEAT